MCGAIFGYYGTGLRFYAEGPGDFLCCRKGGGEVPVAKRWGDMTPVTICSATRYGKIWNLVEYGKFTAANKAI